MKKALILAGLLAIGSFAFAQSVEKVGFLTTKWCLNKGLLADCRMETIFCKEGECYKKQNEFTTDVNAELVLFIHDDGKAYDLELTPGLQLGELLEKAINKNEVTVRGELIGNDKIKVIEYEAPPPPKKSFFKGCL